MTEATGTEDGKKTGTALTGKGEPMSDTISRQAAIDTEGLDEQIRCEMCINPMHTDRGCDGNCKYNEKLYERIMQILDKRIKPLPSAQPEQRLKKIADLVDGTIDHFDRDDAMDLLYQIKEVLKDE